MRLKSLSFILALLLSCQSIASQANQPKVGDKCPGLGAKTKVAGLDLECKKSGKNFKWALKASKLGTGIYAWTPKNNVVTAAIQRKIAGLRKADTTFTANIPIEVEQNVPKDAIDSLKLQIRYITQAFPEVFKAYTSKFIVYRTGQWAIDKAESNNCPVPSVVKDPPLSMHSEAVFCDVTNSSTTVVSFLNWSSYQKYDPAPIRIVGGLDEWANQAAQEGGGSSIQGFYNKSKSLGNWNPLPAWFEQGSQDLLTSIALAVQTRNWRQASLSQGQIRNCPGQRLQQTEFYGPESNYCEYDLGAIASELMVALYGFDAPIAWFKEIELSANQSRETIRNAWESSFQRTYGDSLSTFYTWADAYSEYLGSNGKRNLPADLLNKLSNKK